MALTVGGGAGAAVGAQRVAVGARALEGAQRVDALLRARLLALALVTVCDTEGSVSGHTTQRYLPKAPTVSPTHFPCSGSRPRGQ